MKKSTDSSLLTKLYFHLLPYQVLLLVINAVTGIVDSLFASNCIGKVAMSAICLYSPLNHFLFAVSIILVSGSQLLVGEAMGRNDTEAIHSFFSTDIIVAFIVSMVTSFSLAFVAMSDLTRFLIADAVDRQAMNMYMIGQACGIPALVLGQQLFAFLSLENQTKRTMAASIACIVINTIMDGVFVFYMKLGTLGLGLGTACGMWSFLLIMAVYYFAGRSQMKFSLRKYSPSGTFGILKRGYPGALSRFVELFRCIIVNALIMEYVGSVGLSAFAAINSVMAVFWPLPFGMLAVTRMMLGVSIGEEDRKSLVEVNRIVLVKCFLMQCAVSLFIVLLSGPITQMFYRDITDPVYNITAMGFRMMPLCMPLAVISLHFACYGQAMQDKFLSNILPIVDGAVGVVTCSLVFIPSIKMNGLYLANILNGFICGAVVLGYVIYSIKRIPRSIEDVLLIPDNFGVSEDERIDISVKEMSEVTEVSEKVVDFCRSKNIDKKRSVFTGLALEEMAGNVIEHGFGSDRKNHSIDIRIIHKDDDIIMRIKDNCRSFNPLERIRIHEKNEDFRTFGIKIVGNTAREVQYQNLLGLNVLTIRN